MLNGNSPHPDLGSPPKKPQQSRVILNHAAVQESILRVRNSADIQKGDQKPHEDSPATDPNGAKAAVSRLHILKNELSLRCVVVEITWAF